MRSVRALIMAVCAICITSTQASLDFNKQSKHDQELVNFYFGAIRGLWYGMYRGFFHEGKAPNDKCLSNQATDEVSAVLQFLAYGEFSDIFTVADSLSTLYYDNKQFCGEFEIYQILEEKCHGEDVEACKPMTLVKNVFVKHMVNTFGCLSVIVDTCIKFRINIDAEAFQEQFNMLGKNLGLIVALIFDV